MADEIGHVPNKDRVYALYLEHVATPWRDFKRRLHIYRLRLALVAALLVVAWLLRVTWIIADPIARYRQDSALERELEVTMLPVDTTPIKRYRSIDQYLANRRARSACAEVPLDELRRGRTAPVGGTRHSLTNLFALNRQLIRRERLGFVTPKMLDHPAANACILSMTLREDLFDDTLAGDEPHAHILDMVNPIETEWPRDEPAVATEQVEFRDVLFEDAPTVLVDSVPRLRLRFRTLASEVRVLKLTGVDAHMARAALALMYRGEPVSLWGSTVSTPKHSSPAISAHEADEL